VNKARVALVISVVLTLGLYFLPFGAWLAWPMILISTVAHESGHGLTALLVGGSFQSLHVYADASGVAHWSGGTSRLALAAVAAGGLIGPSVAAAGLFAAARSPRSARWALAALGVFLGVLSLVFVRNLFGFVFVGLLAAVALTVARFTKPETSQLTLVFTAVQLSLSVFSRADYLFTPVAHTSQGAMPSDVANMADALWLPYWMWGLLCGGMSLAILAGGILYFLRK